MPVSTANRSIRRVSLGDDLVLHFAGDVGEAVVAAGVVIDELGVVESHQVQDRGMEVMGVDLVFGGVPPPNSAVAP